MINRFALPYNRVHAAAVVMRSRAAKARAAAARCEDQNSQHAAALRGKAKGYDEAAQILDRLYANRPLKGRRRRRSSSTETLYLR